MPFGVRIEPRRIEEIARSIRLNDWGDPVISEGCPRKLIGWVCEQTKT